MVQDLLVFILFTRPVSRKYMCHKAWFNEKNYRCETLGWSYMWDTGRPMVSCYSKRMFLIIGIAQA